MVSNVWRSSALNRKLLRDLLAMRGQAMAIALVIAGGVSMFVMYFSNFDSLRRTTEAYYTRQRFADVFASLERAPASLESRLSAIPGVAQVETRVAENVMLDVPGAHGACQFLDGLTEGERVVIHPGDTLHAGSRITPADQS